VDSRGCGAGRDLAVGDYEERRSLLGEEWPEEDAEESVAPDTDSSEEGGQTYTVRIMGDAVSARGAVLLDVLGVSRDFEAKMRIAMQTKRAGLDAQEV